MKGLGWGGGRDPHSKRIDLVATEKRSKPFVSGRNSSFVKGNKAGSPGVGTLGRKRKKLQDEFITGV